MTYQNCTNEKADAPDFSRDRKTPLCAGPNGARAILPEVLALLRAQLAPTDEGGVVVPYVDAVGMLLEIVRQCDLSQEKKEAFRRQVENAAALRAEEQTRELESLAETLNRCVQQLRNGKLKMMENITAYLQQHYTDACLSLAMTADHFHVSESYLSSMFKEQSGTNFFAFVEAMRIEKAKTLLKETDLKISKIAESTGYSSANSFCRAFKRTTGDSATSFRSEDKANSEE